MVLQTAEQLANTKNVFSDILKRGASRGNYPGKTKQAIDWFRKTARSTFVSRSTLVNEKTLARNTIIPGNMYMFVYEAKHKDTLPYYDAFPIIFPINIYDDGFLGLNFHYLQPILRAKLMDQLYQLVSDPNLTENTKIKLSYGLLSVISQSNLFKPCIKRYLYSQFRSKYAYVKPDTWDIALFLPTENFKGASNSKVWADSRKVSG